MGLSNELKVGLLMIIAGGLIVVASLAVTGWNPDLSETYEVSVLFDNVAGLQKGSPVQVAGIKVGTVERIELEGDQARVHLKLFAKYEIYGDAEATIKSVGILGDKYVELIRGTSTQTPLQNGDNIQRVQAGNDLDSLVENFGEALNDVRSVTGAMRRSFGGEIGEARFNRILDNVEELTENVNSIAEVTNQRIDGITEQLNIFTRDLAEITQNNKQDISTIVTNVRDISSGLNEITQENRENIREILVNFRDFSGDLQEVVAENRNNIQSLTKDLQDFSGILVEDGARITGDIRQFTQALAKDGPAITGELRDITGEVRGITEDISVLTEDRLGNIMGQLDQFTADLAEITQDNKGSIGQTLSNFEKMSENLQILVVENRQNIQQLTTDLQKFSSVLSQQGPQIATDIQEFTGALAEDGPKITSDLQGILAENRQGLRNSITNLERSFGKLDSTMANLESISQKIDEGTGTLGKLVNDEKTIEELNAALENVNSFLGGVDKLKLDIGVHAEILGKDQSEFDTSSRTKGYLTVKLQPLKDRFYLIQLVTNPRGKRSKTKTTRIRTLDDGSQETIEDFETEVTEELQISAQIVQRYYDTQFKIGLFENEFGLGVEQLFGKNEQFKLALDGWDFGGDFGTHLKAYGIWRFHSNLFVTAGFDDFISDEEDFRDHFVGFGISFNEDVITPFLGSIPIGAIAN